MSSEENVDAPWLFILPNCNFFKYAAEWFSEEEGLNAEDGLLFSSLSKFQI